MPNTTRMWFLKLVRWQNLFIIILAQVLLKYVLFPSFNIDVSLNAWQFSALVIATISLASAGNIINDIYDVETDTINKPNKLIIGKYISEPRAYNLFFAFNFIGVLLGFYISHAINKSGFFALFVIISISLYMYATYLKRTLLMGNILISLLVALSLIIVGIFDVIPAITFENQYQQRFVFKIVLGYSGFAFLLNLIREITKDIEDINGDFKSGMRTLPIVIGRQRASKIALLLSFIPLLLITYYLTVYLYHKPIAVLYYSITVIGPLIYITIHLFSAKTKQDHHHISNLLKVVMLTGLLSLCLYLL